MTPYEIQKNAQAVEPMQGGTPKTEVRTTMEALEVGDAFVVPTEAERDQARYARYRLKPKEFTVRRLEAGGWQVRRTA